MPLYDFECKACRHTFEELAFDDDDVIRCPKCGSEDTARLVSAPSPLKTGAFPFKIGPRPAWMNSNSPVSASTSVTMPTWPIVFLVKSVM